MAKIIAGEQQWPSFHSLAGSYNTCRNLYRCLPAEQTAVASCSLLWSGDGTIYKQWSRWRILLVFIWLCCNSQVKTLNSVRFTLSLFILSLHTKLEKMQLSSIHTTIFLHNCNNFFSRFIIYMDNNFHNNVFRKIFAVLSVECKGLNRYFFGRSTMHRSVHPRQVFQNSPKSLSLSRSKIRLLQAQLKVFVIRRVNQQLWSWLLKLLSDFSFNILLMKILAGSFITVKFWSLCLRV